MKTKVILTKQNLNQKNNQKNKKLIGVLATCLLINFFVLSFIILPSYSNKQEELKAIEKEKELIKNAKIIVTLKEDLTASFFSEKRVSDYIEYINGSIVDDYLIDTTKVGEQDISFEYINEENIKIPYSYKITIKDETPPDIWLGNYKTITTEYEGNLLDDIVCADNIDDNPTCEIIGEYNTKKVGEYKLTFKAQDYSGNQTIKDFTLKVVNPQTGSSSSGTTYKRTEFSDVIKNYKTDNTKIGIDVSSWQGDINFEAVKEAGVEFVFIRVGSTRGIEGEYFVDKKFHQNIQGFNEVGIPVGIYFYSYANSKEKAIQDANWVLEQIEGYKIDLPIAYDWESWSFYNEFNQSFFSLSMGAKAYLDTMKDAGYEGILYSSKNYLEKVWFDIGYDVWLAHYTSNTSYTGPYKYWQMCSNGKIDGIAGNVDINIYYEN